MNRNGPIVIIEDDEEDRQLFQMAFEELKCTNELVFLPDGQQALEYLQRDDIQPFLLLSDINIPKLNGLELRKMIQLNETLSAKCIPYIFISTTVERETVTDAYVMSVQGFFKKPGDYDTLRTDIQAIIRYWEQCYTPANFPN